MSELTRYRDAILDYLRTEKQASQDDIDKHKNLTDDEKEDIGLLIRHAKIVDRIGSEFQFSVAVNNTKLRPGDKVVLMDEATLGHFNAVIIENEFENLFVKCDAPLNPNSLFSVQIVEGVMLDTMIQLIEKIEDGLPGASFLNQLSKKEEPARQGLGGFGYVPSVYDKLNEEQKNICKDVLKRPSLYCVQGPPGTGKTDVLSVIAIQFSKKGKDVLIISNTHQAVNNALNKIASKPENLPLVKIGEELKAVELRDSILSVRTYKDYVEYRKALKKKPKEGSVVGMTLHAAVVNLGLRNSGLKPAVVLVDEAGQMPFAEAACIGTFGCGSVVFLGDDKQMPPIFHENLKDNEFSRSIFTYICDQYPDLKGKLCVTYRMNDEITEYVSSRYYEKDGEKLIPSDYSKDRRLTLNSQYPDENIKRILNEKQSIHVLNVTKDNSWEDYNVEEAKFAAALVKEAICCGLKTSDVAVITPFRKQVRTIRECLKSIMEGQLPLVDTVERLQGQDVEMIVISFSVSDKSYYNSCKEFLLNPNRINVMVSRAKTKVVILASDVVKI